MRRREHVSFRTLRKMQIAALIFSLLPCVLIIFQEFALKNTSFY